MTPGCSDRKGNVALEIISIIGVIVIITFTLMSLYKPIKTMDDSIQTDPEIAEIAKNASTIVADELPAAWDDSLAMIFIILGLGSIILAYFIDAHPVWFVATTILFIVALLAAVYLSNTFEEITLESFEDAREIYPKMVWIIQHLLEISIGYGILISISLYAKTQRSP